MYQARYEAGTEGSLLSSSSFWLNGGHVRLHVTARRDTYSLLKSYKIICISLLQSPHRFHSPSQPSAFLHFANRSSILSFTCQNFDTFQIPAHMNLTHSITFQPLLITLSNWSRAGLYRNHNLIPDRKIIKSQIVKSQSTRSIRIANLPRDH